MQEHDFIYQTNDHDRVNIFKQIVTAGWANMSDGDVESPAGHFALVAFNDRELTELIDAVFDRDDERIEAHQVLDKGSYCFMEDSDGFGLVYKMRSYSLAVEWFQESMRIYIDWVDAWTGEE